jgi:hypothetical protein
MLAINMTMAGKHGTREVSCPLQQNNCISGTLRVCSDIVKRLFSLLVINGVQNFAKTLRKRRLGRLLGRP